MKMYRAVSYSVDISEYEVIKKTEKSIYYISAYGIEYRELKSSSYYKWFESKLEAVEHVKNRITNQINTHKYNISVLKAQLKLLS